jgi:hypothetical protein
MAVVEGEENEVSGSSGSTGALVKNKPTSSGAGNFTNIKKFLDVNRPKIQQEANVVGQGLTDATTTSQGVVSQNQAAADEGIAAGTIAPVDVSGQNLTEIAGGEGAAALQHKGYTGASGEELAAQNRYGLNKAEDANRALQQTATEGGAAGAFRNQYGGRALTLAERSALGQGGNLTQSLADARKTSQAGLENLAGKDYVGQVQATQEANEAARRGVRDRVNVLSGNLATEVANSAAAQGAETDAARVAALTQTASGQGPEFEAAANTISEQLISQGYDPSSTAFRTAGAAALAKVREAATAQLGKFESGANKTVVSGQSALESNADYQKRMAALTSLSGMTDGINLGNYSTKSSTYDPWSTTAQQQGYADTSVAAYLEKAKAREIQRAFEAAARSGTTDASGVVRDPLAEAGVASPIDAAVSSTTAATNAATEPARAIDKEVRSRLGLPG